MKVLIYNESTRAKHSFDTLKEMRQYAGELASVGKDWGMWSETRRNPYSTATPYELAEVLYGSWGRVVLGSHKSNG